MFKSTFVHSIATIALVSTSSAYAAGAVNGLPIDSCFATWKTDPHHSIDIGGLADGRSADVEIFVPRRGLLTVGILGEAELGTASLSPSPCNESEARHLQSSAQHRVSVVEAGTLSLRITADAGPLVEGRLAVHFLPFDQPAEPVGSESDPFQAPCTPAPTKNGGENDDEGEIDPDGFRLPCLPMDIPFSNGENDDEGEIDPDGLHRPEPTATLANGENDDEGEIDPDGVTTTQGVAAF